MTDLTDLSTRALALLGDVAGARYSAGILEESFRQALEFFDQYFPQIETATITLDTLDRNVPLDTLQNCKRIISIVHPADNPSQLPSYSPPFYVYFKDAIPWVHFVGTYVPVLGDEYLILYETNHWIDGLDDAMATTVPYELRGLLVRGACAIAKGIRASLVNEDYGTRSSETERLLQQSVSELESFVSDLSLKSSFSMTGYPAGFQI